MPPSTSGPGGQGCPGGPLPAPAPAVSPAPHRQPPLPSPAVRCLASSICHLPDVEMQLVSPPQGHLPPRLPSAGAGSSRNWRWGEQRRCPAGPCRAISPRSCRCCLPLCCFPKPLTLLLLFTLFTLPPASPAPRRECGYGPWGGCTGGAGAGQRASAVAPPAPPPGKDAGTSLPSLCPLSPAPLGTSSSLWAPSRPSGHLLAPRQDLGMLPARTAGGAGWRWCPHRS